MKTLIYAPRNKEIGGRVKDWLDDFGKGLHTYVAWDGESEKIAEGDNWSHVLILGVEKLPESIATQGSSVITLGDEANIRHQTYVIYRDILSDMVGSRCTCGLYDVCHCH